ncbi:MAG: glycosyltransferase [Actinobacteria bacterium]|nr:glycosyltransferase [Actinomycetota bacterium]NBY15198.1 glycosyltransferase [Actinomycetota bacterium]
MKILHAFTLQSPDNAFGGPIRVALNLAHELKSRDIKVELVGGCRDYPTIPQEIEGINANLFAVRQIHAKLGFSGLISLKLLAWAWRNVRNFDVVHIHLARDLITLPITFICRLRNVPYVIQGHGMIDPTQRATGRILDFLLVRKSLIQASKLLYLTEQEQQDYPAVAKSALSNLAFLPNGVPAQSKSSAVERTSISFISRLQERKRPTRFVEMAAKLSGDENFSDFKIAGADEGELNAVLSLIEKHALAQRVTYVGPKDHDGVLDLLSRTLILVLPSVNEPFPMIILEALSCGIPVVLTDSCGLAPYIQRGNAGIVTDGSVDGLVNAVKVITQDLLTYSASALELAQKEFSMKHIGDELLAIYRAATS